MNGIFRIKSKRLSLFVVSLLLFSLFVSFPLVSADWVMFHHDLAHTGYSDSVPVVGVQLWNFTTGSSIVHSSPAVSDGVVYFGSGDGKLYAFGVVSSPVPPYVVQSVPLVYYLILVVFAVIAVLAGAYKMSDGSGNKGIAVLGILCGLVIFFILLFGILFG
jgi:hypothetical protein